MHKAAIVITIIAACSSAHALAITNDDSKSAISIVERDASNLGTTAPFHSCFLADNDKGFHECMSEAGLPSKPSSAVQQRDLLGALKKTLPSMTWADKVFGGEETCYQNLTDQKSWAAVADIKSVLGPACDTVIPTALRLISNDKDAPLSGTWQGMAVSYLTKKLVPIQVTLAITGIQKITGGKAVEMVQNACSEGLKRLTGDDTCLTQRDKAVTANGGSVIWDMNADTFMQMIFELGESS